MKGAGILLNFLGIGSCFNVELNNTSAFIKTGQTLFLIDCGGNIFKEILKLNLLKNTKNINVSITHTHSDHIGSLADLILYSYHVLKIKPTVFFPDKKLIQTFLECVGVSPDTLSIVSDNKTTIFMDDQKFLSIEFVQVEHVQTIPAFGMLLDFENSSIYYSGDSKNIPKDVLNRLLSNKLDFLYQDTSYTSFPTNVHLPFSELCNLIPSNYRNKVFCIHQDASLTSRQIKAHGFNVPKHFKN